MPFGRSCDGGSDAERGEKTGGKFHHPEISGKSSPAKFNRTSPAAKGQGNNDNAKNPGSQGQPYPSR